MVAVPLIFGRLTAEDYEDAVACDARIDLLRNKMQVIERKQFTIDYLDPAKRSIGNSVQVFFKDDTQTERVAVEYPIGHRRRRKEGVPALLGKYERNLRGRIPAQSRRDHGALLRSREPGDNCCESLRRAVRRLMLRSSKGKSYRTYESHYPHSPGAILRPRPPGTPFWSYRSYLVFGAPGSGKGTQARRWAGSTLFPLRVR
jgi:hypothetical protein